MLVLRQTAPTIHRYATTVNLNAFAVAPSHLPPQSFSACNSKGPFIATQLNSPLSCIGEVSIATPTQLDSTDLLRADWLYGFVGGDSPFLVTCGDYRKRHQLTPHYAWLWTLAQAVNRTSGRSGSASEDDPSERGCSRSRTTLGSTPTTPGGSHMTASLGGHYDPWPVKCSTD